MMKQAKAAEEARPRLGRGLAALIGEAAEPAGDARSRGQKKAPIEFLRPNPRNPRRAFDEAELEDLASSIREKGVIQPILVRPAKNLVDAYEIIAGERRWRAAQRAGLHEVPIVVVEATDAEALELAIIENVQRSDLNALEEAAGYERLGAEFSYSHADIARLIGKSRSHVANTMRLTKLPERTRALLAEGRLTAGHARALLMIDQPDQVAERIVAEGLSVRDVERLLQEKGDTSKRGGPRKAEKDPNTRALELALSTGLGLKVTIAAAGERGELRIAYLTLEQLDAVVRRLNPG
ncbi:parB-like partition protein [Methylocella silvestris BL2]|uniref:ParB-like partition protein n=1 Tax=Methylocella silvestris (strain DSM 15510 / CIP 108128 / LMG 27833 / NCIMB 13906 / BL2) TaxID=395965 RepID=B8EQ24_METSB|nr:ParB/RepB/Spo0J family partition protein [Methylocella silvestris]ACK51514.1 parB-like partition protein [Methylocella silvestris BL2]